MYRWTSSLDIGLGMAYGNRMTKMERKLIGMMVSTVPLRMDIDPEEEVLSFISRVSRKQSKSLRHQKYPFDLLLKQINKENNSNVRLFGTTIDYRIVMKVVTHYGFQTVKKYKILQFILKI